jgi:hypothetical protein
MRRSARIALAALLTVGAAALPAYGQLSTVYTAAVPPLDAALEPLRLKTEWTMNLPIEGRSDTISHVQVVDGGQIFVQTRSGTLLSVDAQTGQRQWSIRFPGRSSTSYPVAVNSRFVFIVNLSRLYCFHRRTGILEFSFEPIVRVMEPLAGLTSGPVCSETHVYVVIGYQEVLSYKLPASITQPDPATTKNLQGIGNFVKVKNPADMIAARYPGTPLTVAQTDPPTRSRGLNRPDFSGMTHQRSPSIAVLPSVTPPYELKDRNGQLIQRTDSLTPLNTMRYPYQLKDGEGRYIVKTPSVTVIPPSVARAFELNDIRPKQLAPTKEWSYQATSRIAFEPVLAGPRMWLTFQTSRALAFDRVDMTTQLRTVLTDGRLSAAPAAGMVADGSAGFLALADGSAVAIDLAFGGFHNQGALKQLWRANVGGPMNRHPVVTPTSLFVGGTASGISRIDRKDGTHNYRTTAEDDFLLSVTDESLYTRTRNGLLRVYDLQSPTEPGTHFAAPLGEIALPGFDIPVTNPVNDRIILASDNGLLVCLRDSSAKYAAIKPTLPPPAPAPAPVKKDDSGTPEAPNADPAPKPNN